jgi:hypothetical protein
MNEKAKLPFFKIYNSFLQHSKYKLSPKELSLYALLEARQSPFLHRTETTINSIVEIQNIFNDETRNAKNIKSLILNLNEKGVIDLRFKGEKLGFNTLIIITFPEPDNNGFEPIYRNLYDATDDSDEFYVLCVIAAFGKKGFTKKLELWSDVIGYKSKNTGAEIIERMLDKKLISRQKAPKQRETNGNWAQDPSKYYLNLKQTHENVTDKEVKKILHQEHVMDKPLDKRKEILIESSIEPSIEPSYSQSDVVDEINFQTVFGEFTVSDIRRRINNSNLGKKIRNKEGIMVNSQLVYEDYATYRIVKEVISTDPFVKQFEGAMQSYKKQSFYNGLFEKFEKEYNQHVLNVEEMRQMKQATDKMAQMKGTPLILYDNTVIELDQKNVNRIDKKSISEVAYFVTDHYWNGHYDEEKQNLERHSLHDIVGVDRHFTEETWGQILDYFIILAIQHKFTIIDAEDLLKFTDDLCIQLNVGKPYDSDWEGDEWDIDEHRTLNISRKERVRKLK